MDINDIRAKMNRRANERDDGNTIWLEVRVTQGRDWDADEEDMVSRVIESAFDVPLRNIFCQTERNIMRCFARFDIDRLPVRRITFIEDRLIEADRTNDEFVNRSIDEFNVVDADEVLEFIPEAVPEGQLERFR